MSVHSILGGFIAATVSEAAELNTQRLAKVGRIDELTADLFESIGLSMVASGKRGASPKGAHARLTLLCTGDAPSRAILKGIAKDWATVVQGLHGLVSMLHTANACDAPCALPAWADPVALAAAKAAKAAKAAATRAANKATAAGDDGDEGADSGADGGPAILQALPTAPAANLIAAAIKAQAYTMDDLRVIMAALVAANVEPATQATEQPDSVEA